MRGGVEERFREPEATLLALGVPEREKEGDTGEVRRLPEKGLGGGEMEVVVGRSYRNEGES